MIKQTSLDFLSKLKKNNSKDWFEQNRDLYEHYKTDILELTEKFLTGLSQFHQSISQANLDSKKCLTRLNRDLRFSKDKNIQKLCYNCLQQKWFPRQHGRILYLN